MKQNSQINATTERFNDKRSYERYRIVQPGICQTSDEQELNCTIRDFCLGGMLLNFDEAIPSEHVINDPRLSVDEIIIIRCEPEFATLQKKRLQFLGRIVRNSGLSLGISLLNPSQTSLQQLVDIAAQQKIANKAATTEVLNEKEQAAGDKIQHDEIINACKQVITDQIKPIIQELQKLSHESLFKLAGHTKNTKLANDFFDSMNIIENSASQMLQDFSNSVEQFWMHPEKTSASKSSKSSKITSASLSLVDKDDFDHWLAITDIISQIETESRDLLTEIEHRLSIVYPYNIDSDNNPLGPSILARPFEQIIKKLGLSHLVAQHCYTLIKSILLRKAKQIYTQINAVLVDADILPEIIYNIKKDKAGQADNTAAQDDHEPATTDSAPDTNDQAENINQAIKDLGHNDIQGLLEEVKQLRLLTGKTATAASAPQFHTAPTFDQQHQPNNTQHAQQDIQALSQEILSLRQLLHAPSSATPASVQNPSGSQPAVGTIQQSAIPDSVTTVAPASATPAALPTSTDQASAIAPSRASSQHTQTGQPAQNIVDVVQQLKQLQQTLHQRSANTTSHAAPTTAQEPVNNSALFNTPPGAQQTDTYTTDELINALSLIPTTTSGSNDINNQLNKVLQQLNTAGAAKELSSHERKILDVTGELFGSLLQDKMLADNVRQWISQLELPLLKLALNDNNLFLDKNHAARRFVNRLAQLEIYGEHNTTANNDAVTRKIDGMINKIVQSEKTSADNFHDALKEISFLIKIQDQAYQENILDVIKESIREYSRSHNNTPAIEATANLSVEMQQKIKLTQRIQAGDWVLFHAKNNRTKRLRLAWKSDDNNHFVFVNLMGRKDITLRAEQLAALLKNHSAQLLDNSIDPAVDRAQYNMLQNLHHELLYETTHDHLTGLINRDELKRKLKNLLSEERSNSHVLAHIDINQFNVINNMCGYEAGDQLLGYVSKLLAKDLQQDSLLARIGADEFVILMHQHSLKEAEQLIAKKITAIKDYRFHHNNERYSISLSIGLFAISPDNLNTEEILSHSAEACRQANALGTNQVFVYDANDSNIARRNQIMRWVSRIDHALDNDSLDLRFQPITPILPDSLGQPHHCEILLSVADEDGQFISPENFILAAEHYHRMTTVDRWVITTLFRWIESHPAEFKQAGGFAINLSGLSVNDESFKDFLLEQINKHHIPTEHICFEVTETAGIANLSNASIFIEEIKKTGCSFSLDDFGSGLSSYAYLKNLPVDYLKIDGAFVKHMDINPSDYAVVKSICEIGHFMGKQVIAEYVENDTIIELLREIGVDYAQGYVIAKPQSISSLEN